MVRGLLTGPGISTKIANTSPNKDLKKPAKKAGENKPTLGAAGENPLFHGSPVRTLPAELKNRILSLSHPKQSLTALFTTLFQATDFPGVRQHDYPVTALDVMKFRGTPAMPMSLSDMAKMIGRSPYPNAQRDLLKNDPQQSATLHPEIELLGSESRAEATAYEREQLQALLGADYSELDKLGKVSGGHEARLIESIERKISGNLDDNPNRHDSAAPSTSAVSDAMLHGLSTRLAELKADLRPALKTVTSALYSSHYVSINHGPEVPVGPSRAGRYAALRNLLMAVGSLKKSASGQYDVFNAVVDALDGRFHLDAGQKIDLTVHFVNALSEFAKERTGGSAIRLDHMAMCTFKTIIGNRTLSITRQVDRLAKLFSPSQRAYIIGKAAKGLESQLSDIRNSPIEESQAKNMAAFVDKSKSIVPWRSSQQGAILNHMLEALQLDSREYDFDKMNLLRSAENTPAWTGLLATAPKLNKDSQKKIYEGFLKQIEESRLLTSISPKDFESGCMCYASSRLSDAIPVGDLNSCRDIFTPAFEQLRSVLPTVQNKKLEQRLSKVLNEYTSVLSETSRQRFLESEG